MHLVATSLIFLQSMIFKIIQYYHFVCLVFIFILNFFKTVNQRMFVLFWYNTLVTKIRWKSSFTYFFIISHFLHNCTLDSHSQKLNSRQNNSSTKWKCKTFAVLQSSVVKICLKPRSLKIRTMIQTFKGFESWVVKARTLKIRAYDIIYFNVKNLESSRS